MSNQQELRQRREALLQAVNSHDKEAVLSFIHPTFVGKGMFGITLARYQHVVRIMEQLFAPGIDYQETVAIEEIEVSGDSARLLVRRVARGRSRSQEDRVQETWRLIDDRWLLVEERQRDGIETRHLFVAVAVVVAIGAYFAEGAAELRKLGRSGEWSTSGEGADGQMVNLTHSPLTNAQLRNLLRLEVFQELRELYIGHSRITDKGLKHLKPQRRLEKLSLRATEISDAGLEHLSGLESLSLLDLYKTNVTEQGLRHLERLTGLKSLDLRGTDVTEEGVQKLREAIPACRVKF